MTSQIPADRTKHSSTAFSSRLAILWLALALNLHGLAASSFWGDEILTASFASAPAAEVIRWTAGDIHPPLYYLLAGAFTASTVPLGAADFPTSASDWLWRFPSVVAAVLAVAVTYRLARYLGPRPMATAAALLLSVAPVVIKYGQEARMHALFMLLSALSAWLLLRAVDRPERWPRWLAFALATTANLYTMYFGFLILAAQGVLVLGRLRSARGAVVRGFSLAAALALGLYGPWWPVLIGILQRRAAVGAIEGGVGSPLEFLAGIVQALGPGPPGAAWAFLALFGLGLALLARRDGSLAALAGLWLALPAALPILLGDPRALQFRYAFVLPVYLPVIAYALWRLSAMLQAGPSRVAIARYLTWLLASISFVAALAVYQQVKPDWRGAAAYLDAHTLPADIILIGPLWDEGRFIDYYYRGRAQLLTPAGLVTNIERRAEELRANGSRVWAVNRFAPAESAAFKNVSFPGVVVTEPTLPVYEPALLSQAAISLAAQAVEAAYPWAATASAQGVLNPDPRTARAGALRALGDTLLAAGQPAEAVAAYQSAVDIFPGWVSGFVALAEAQEAAGNLPAAAEAYRQAVAFNSKWQGPAADEATALANAGNWPAALQKYRDIIQQ